MSRILSHGRALRGRWTRQAADPKDVRILSPPWFAGSHGQADSGSRPPMGLASVLQDLEAMTKPPALIANVGSLLHHLRTRDSEEAPKMYANHP